MATAAVCLSAFAKDIQTLVVTTNPQMHCDACESKIKHNMRFEKGVKNIVTDIPTQKVTITYDADRNTPENLMKAFEKFGYTAMPADSVKVCPAEAEGESSCCQD